MIPVEIDTALEDFFERLLQEYVYFWYSEISYDEDFVQEIRYENKYIHFNPWVHVMWIEGVLMFANLFQICFEACFGNLNQKALSHWFNRLDCEKGDPRWTMPRRRIHTRGKIRKVFQKHTRNQFRHQRCILGLHGIQNACGSIKSNQRSWLRAKHRRKHCSVSLATSL